MKLSKPDFLKSPLEHFRDSLESSYGEKGQVFREKSVKKKMPFVYTLTFPQTASHGMRTYSYGVSFAPHPDQHNRIELFLEMDATDMAWAHIVGYLANNLRGDCPFLQGEIIRIGQQISSDSGLNAFVVVPAIEESAETQVRDGKKASPIHIMQLIPIFEQEVLTIQKMGLERFLTQLRPQLKNPKRKAF